MQLAIDSLFGSTTNLALAILITTGIGVLFIGSILVFGYVQKRRNQKDKI